jgi:hypothetical protein
MDDNWKKKISELATNAQSITDPVERSRKYKNIVGLICQESVHSNDMLYLEEAKKIAALVTDDPSKAYVEIVRAIAKLPRKDKTAFDEAVKITQNIDNDLDLSVALHEISVAFGKFGIDKDDKALYSDCLDLIQTIPLDTYRSMALRNISKVLAGKNHADALGLLERSIGIIEKSTGIHNIYLVYAFCETAVLLAILNDKRSYSFLNKAKAKADSISDEFERSAVFLKILETNIEMGNKLTDEKLLDEAAIISKNITKEYYKTLAKNVS